LNALRARRNRLIAPYFGFVLLFFSCGAAAGTGQVQSQWVWLLALLVLCAIPIIILNLTLHSAIQRVAPSAGSSGMKQTVISSLLVTPIEAALILPAINLTIATRILRRGGPPPNKPRQQGRPNGRPCSGRYVSIVKA
jgi:membrane protein implicated in regulation of membrane protease activity